MEVPFICGFDDEWGPPWLILGTAEEVAGEFLGPSSFLTRADVDGVGEAIEPDILRARSS
jgi:hypothetical protein